MTRINCGIQPSELTDKHLLAEHREIKRIPNCISNGRYSMNNIPTEFVLGVGHVKFFYNKLEYLLNRYISLYNECKFRNFNVENYTSTWDGLPKHLMNNYQPTIRDRKIVQSRINERLKKSGNYKNTRKLI